jgi:hypothetical protein
VVPRCRGRRRPSRRKAGPRPAVDDADAEGVDEGADQVVYAFSGSLADLHDKKSA